MDFKVTVVPDKNLRKEFAGVLEDHKRMTSTKYTDPAFHRLLPKQDDLKVLVTNAYSKIRSIAQEIGAAPIPGMDVDMEYQRKAKAFNLYFRTTPPLSVQEIQSSFPEWAVVSEIPSLSESTFSTKKLVEKYLYEGFFKPQVYQDSGILVDTGSGAHFISNDSVSWRGPDNATEDNEIEPYFDSIVDFLPTEVRSVKDVYSVDKFSGWVGRLSASGYTDATDFVWGPTKDDVIDQLQKLYGDDTLDAEDELYFQLEQMRSNA